MSLHRISFLEGWERNSAAFLRRRPEDSESRSGRQSDEESDSYQDLPEPSLSSSFPSTYSRLNFNPYAGPGWNESTVDDDRPSFLALSPTATRDSHTGPPDCVQGPESFAPAIAPSQEPSRGEWETIGAFEVSAAKRIAQVFFAVLYCFLAAGVVFGFAALKPVLVREKVYRNLCSTEELEQDVPVCDGQEIRLNLMFTIAAVVTNVFALPVGTILDAYGPRVSGIIGSVCLAFGALLFGWANKLPFDGYIPGYLFLSLGGPFVFISSFHLSNTFPTRSGLILSMLTGAFDASSALFLIFRLLNEHTQGAVSIQSFFLVYLVVPVFIVTAQVFVMPATSYKTTGELVQQAEAHLVEELHDQVDPSIHDRGEGERQRNERRVHRQSVVSQIQDLLDDDTASTISAIGNQDSVFQTNLTEHQPNNNNTRNNTTGSSNYDNHTDPSSQPQKIPPGPAATGHTSGLWGVLHGRSALHQVRTPWFILITLFTVLMMLRINYFVASLRQQYTYLLSSATLARQINSTFDILLPVGGLLSVPFIGTFLDTFHTCTVLAILVTTATVIGALSCIPHSLGAAYANIALFVLFRPFYYTAVSDYAAKVFGFQTFGKVYGLIICLAGVGNFAQAGLDALTLKTFDGNPIPVNVALMILVGGVGIALVAFVTWQTLTVDSNDEPGLSGVTGSGEGAQYPGVMARDWERQPLLARGSMQGERTARSYGA
ncbi:Major facilitator superfamily domain general substrate transporter [Penicillium alfredii]|uniref:Major facilitator superfamily domain general substrate transporter n=1 Tax=Penicillium alfredii TaxID=1506179 RepID=A0A9W9K7Y7_9EURO|nr:Major facilitator superfamily domain general substrate transporter [Penicillium alfredii]KAJ5096373.1 Major facilitator superfamily domain general substrate transporter [Penicillium alfredii]